MTEHDPLKTYFELPEELADINSAKAAILPVPYDETATWKKGASRAPEAILEASHHIEHYDVVTGIEPGGWGIATLDPVEFSGPPEVLADRVDERVAELIERGVLPVTLGGDHSISIGAIRAAARLVPGMTVLQLDAHSASVQLNRHRTPVGIIMTRADVAHHALGPQLGKGSLVQVPGPQHGGGLGCDRANADQRDVVAPAPASL